MRECEKYEHLWQFDVYRRFSPGEHLAYKFVEVVKPFIFSRIVDFGCGTGRGGMTISKLVVCQMTLLDFVYNSRDVAAQNLPFLCHDLNEKIPLECDYGYCTDVLEHIAPHNVEKVIINIMNACSECFFNICTVQELLGELIGEQLHLTVQPHEWWLAVFKKLGYTVLWHESCGSLSLFHVNS